MLNEFRQEHLAIRSTFVCLNLGYFTFQMEYASEQEKVLEDEGGWVDTHHFADKELENKVSEMNLEDASSSSPGNLRLV